MIDSRAPVFRDPTCWRLYTDLLEMGYSRSDARLRAHAFRAEKARGARKAGLTLKQIGLHLGGLSVETTRQILAKQERAKWFPPYQEIGREFSVATLTPSERVRLYRLIRSEKMFSIEEEK